MRQFVVFIVPKKENYVCHLKKSLLRQWYRRFDAFMIRQDYTRCHYDNCVCFQQLSDSFIYLLLYINDMLIVSKDKSLISRLKSQLCNEFEIQDLRATKKILGMEIHKDRKARKLYLFQRKYLEKVLNRFNMSICKPITTSLIAHFVLSAESCPTCEVEIEKMSYIPYSNTMGSLMYAMVCTRPNLAYVVSVVSRYMHNPGKNNCEAIKWVLRYVKGFLNRRLVFDKSKTATYDIAGFVDSDYGGDIDRECSTSSYIFTLCASAISWKSSLQPIVALFTTVA